METCHYGKQDSLSSLTPWLRPLAARLAEHTMLNAFKPRLDNIYSSFKGIPPPGSQPLDDRFRVVLDIGKHSFNAEFTFLWWKKSMKPEIFFDECKFQPPLLEMPEYCSWNADDSLSLVKLYDAIFDFYRQWQLQQCSADQLVNRQLQSLTKAGYQWIRQATTVFSGPDDAVIVLPIVVGKLVSVPTYFAALADVTVTLIMLVSHTSLSGLKMEWIGSAALQGLASVLDHSSLLQFLTSVGDYLQQVAQLLQKHMNDQARVAEMRNAIFQLLLSSLCQDRQAVSSDQQTEDTLNFEWTSETGLKMVVIVNWTIDGHVAKIKVNVRPLTLNEQDVSGCCPARTFNYKFAQDMDQQETVTFLCHELTKYGAQLSQKCVYYMEALPSYEQSVMSTSCDNPKLDE